MQATPQQFETLSKLDVAEVWEERGTFLPPNHPPTRTRLRVSTYDVHDFGVLILNVDGRLWDDSGEIELLPVARAMPTAIAA